jgi:heme transporter
MTHSTTLRSMAYGMIIVACITVLAAATLLPALIAILRTRLAGRRGSRAMSHDGQALDRCITTVIRHPRSSALAAAATLLLLAVPLIHIRLDERALPQFSRTDTARTGAVLASRHLGPGALGPIDEVLTLNNTARATPQAVVASYAASLRRVNDVARVESPTLAPGARQIGIAVVPRTPPDAPQTEQLVSHLRDQGGQTTSLLGIARVDVGGPTALNVDLVTLVRHSLWVLLATICLTTYLVLATALRSIVLPLKALLCSMLSVVASLGLTVAVFQDGLLGGSPPGYVDAIAPPLILVLVLALSMDYEMLLLSRIKEARHHAQDDSEAVVVGVSRSAPAITSAALIMVTVFVSFALVAVPSIREIGFSLAVAIALDATIVRLILAPAIMHLLGGRNWWLPTLPQRARRLAQASASDRARW